jgi:hypothetical protein
MDEMNPSALLAELKEIRRDLAVLSSGVAVTAKFFRDTATFLIAMGLAFWILGVTIVVDRTIGLRGMIPLFIVTAGVWFAGLIRLSLANRIERMLARNRHERELIVGIERHMAGFLFGWRAAWLEAANYRGARTVMVLSKLSLLSWMVVVTAVVVDLILLLS